MSLLLINFDLFGKTPPLTSVQLPQQGNPVVCSAQLTSALSLLAKSNLLEFGFHAGRVAASYFIFSTLSN